MLNKSKKINAFTVVEMLVVLVISSIVISITLVVLNLVQNQIRSIQNVYKANTEIAFLERVLTQDFNSYNLYYDARLETLKCTSEIDSVFYKFSQDFIIRNTDTLTVKIDKKVFHLDGFVVREGVIDAIELHIKKAMINEKKFIFKQKDASYYMN